MQRHHDEAGSSARRRVYWSAFFTEVLPRGEILIWKAASCDKILYCDATLRRARSCCDGSFNQRICKAKFRIAALLAANFISPSGAKVSKFYPSEIQVAAARDQDVPQFLRKPRRGYLQGCISCKRGAALRRSNASLARRALINRRA